MQGEQQHTIMIEIIWSIRNTKQSVFFLIFFFVLVFCSIEFAPFRLILWNNV